MPASGWFHACGADDHRRHLRHLGLGGYPAYVNYINRSKQTEAGVGFMQAKLEQEMFWADATSKHYAGTIGVFLFWTIVETTWATANSYSFR